MGNIEIPRPVFDDLLHAMTFQAQACILRSLSLLVENGYTFSASDLDRLADKLEAEAASERAA